MNQNSCSITLYNYSPTTLYVGSSFPTPPGMVGGVLPPVIIQPYTSANFPYRGLPVTFTFSNHDQTINYGTYIGYAPISVTLHSFSNPQMIKTGNSCVLNSCGLYIIQQ